MITKHDILAAAAAVAGGILGVYGFLWVSRQGFYALLLPGGLTGIGASLFRCRSVSIPIFTAVLSLLLGIVAEWRFAPFVADSHFGYFLSHLQDLRPVTMLMIGGGAVLGLWLPLRRILDSRRRDTRDRTAAQ